MSDKNANILLYIIFYTFIFLFSWFFLLITVMFYAIPEETVYTNKIHPFPPFLYIRDLWQPKK